MHSLPQLHRVSTTTIRTPHSEQHTTRCLPTHQEPSLFLAFGLALQSIWPIWLVSQLYNCCGSSSWEWMSGVWFGLIAPPAKVHLEILPSSFNCTPVFTSVSHICQTWLSIICQVRRNQLYYCKIAGCRFIFKDTLGKLRSRYRPTLGMWQRNQVERNRLRHESVASCNALLTGADAPGVRVPAHHTPSHVTGGSTEYRSSDFLPVSVAREEVSQGRGEEEGLTRERWQPASGRPWRSCPGWSRCPCSSLQLHNGLQNLASWVVFGD